MKSCRSDEAIFEPKEKAEEKDSRIENEEVDEEVTLF